MRLLFVEDDNDKAFKITSEIAAYDSEIVVIRARSFTSALRELAKNGEHVSGVLLDMSMPNFDELQEAPENFAGRDLLRQCKLRKIEKPTVVVTMLDSFGSGDEQITLEQLDRQLAEEFSPKYLGIIYYSSAQESWKQQLEIFLKRIREYGK
ncbi:MAG: hypothetical protein ACN6PR_05080 [Achromobacter sp.]